MKWYVDWNEFKVKEECPSSNVKPMKQNPDDQMVKEDEDEEMLPTELCLLRQGDTYAHVSS